MSPLEQALMASLAFTVASLTGGIALHLIRRATTLPRSIAAACWLVAAASWFVLAVRMVYR